VSDQPRLRPFRTVGRGTAQAIVFLFALAFLLSGASYWLAVHAVQGEVTSRASVVQLCQASNESRAQQVTLGPTCRWHPPPHETAAQASGERQFPPRAAVPAAELHRELR
jgi:hypothetical protein